MVTDTVFNRRTGTHEFRPITQTNGWVSLVNCWHQKVHGGLAVEYVSSQTPGSPDHEPVWTVTPKILGELHPEYGASGPNVPIAKEESAKLIGTSGHCVSRLFINKHTQSLMMRRRSKLIYFSAAS
ncbi:hypothetical protein B0J17DRAFT_723940 [Rhizoctonia solani]|nr:hypothetical protein B0J17DRAFT_723940 [Rhizoctonia solani]